MIVNKEQREVWSGTRTPQSLSDFRTGPSEGVAVREWSLSHIYVTEGFTSRRVT